MFRRPCPEPLFYGGEAGPPFFFLWGVLAVSLDYYFETNSIPSAKELSILLANLSSSFSGIPRFFA
jgi:hypothetical protein